MIRSHLPTHLSWLCCLVAVSALGLARAQVPADPLDTLVFCADLPPGAGPEQTDNCIDAAAPAMGEIDPEWRKRMPPKVRWVVDKDALRICSAGTSNYGRLVGPIRDRGCVWVTEQTCTILTVAYLAHAEIGQALRTCAVR